VVYFARWVKVAPPESLRQLVDWRQRIAELVGQAST